MLSGAVVALLTFLFPPWYSDLGQKGFRDDADLMLGRSFIGSPIHANAQIDWAPLAIDLVAVGLIVLLVLYALEKGR